MAFGCNAIARDNGIIENFACPVQAAMRCDQANGPVWGPRGLKPNPDRPSASPTGPRAISNCSHTSCSHIHRLPSYGGPSRCKSGVKSTPNLHPFGFPITQVATDNGPCSPTHNTGCTIVSAAAMEVLVRLCLFRSFVSRPQSVSSPSLSLALGGCVAVLVVVIIAIECRSNRSRDSSSRSSSSG